MKKTILIYAFLSVVLLMSAATQVKVTRIDPTDWYVGLKNPTLQLMVYGQNVRDAEVSVDYPNVRIDSIARLDSPNYLLIYLDLNGAQPGEMTLKIGKQKVKYLLKQREMSGDKRMGFTNADVLYMLMPDRFASSGKYTEPKAAKKLAATLNNYVVDRKQPSLRHGGDLEGIRQHLDYFNQLGVTALWFTPVLENNSPDNEAGYSTYHGYATTDYYRVDPRFGTNAEYRQLADEAHAKGLKIVMDMIFNHCGFEHPWVKDRPSKDWFNLYEWLEGKDKANFNSDPRGTNFQQTSYKLTPVKDPYASEIDLKETVDGWFVPTMPDLNQRNPHVMTYLIQNSIWWIETVGIDGIRMDTYPYAYADAMARWMKRLDTEYPNFNTVGETWVENPAYTAAWQKGNKMGKPESYLKTVMDFSFYEKMDSARHEETDGWWRGYNRVYNSLCLDYLYPNPSSVMAFIENHDTDRYLHNGQDVPALKQALALLLTIKRIPQLYYGTEVLMNGTKEVTDGNVRKDFPGGFPGDAQNAFTAEGRTAAQNDMFNWLSSLLHWRQGNEVITKGKMTQFIPKDGIYVIAREYKGRHAVTIINGTTQQRQMKLDRYSEVFGNATVARDVPTGKNVSLADGALTLPARGTLVLEF